MYISTIGTGDTRNMRRQIIVTQEKLQTIAKTHHMCTHTHTLKVSGKTGVKEKAVMIKQQKPRNNTKRI